MRWQVLWGWHCIARCRSRRIWTRYRRYWINTWAQRTSIRATALISIRPITWITVCVIWLNHHSISGMRAITCLITKIKEKQVKNCAIGNLRSQHYHLDHENCQCNAIRHCRALIHDYKVLDRLSQSPSF